MHKRAPGGQGNPWPGICMQAFLWIGNGSLPLWMAARYAATVRLPKKTASQRWIIRPISGTCMWTKHAGGRTVGVIPQFMVDRGWHHRGLGELKITESMHIRKELMASLSSAAIALPGGIGTFEELLEIITWRQLGLYDGNIVIYNVDGYYDNLLAMLDTAVDLHFMKTDHKRLWT